MIIKLSFLAAATIAAYVVSHKNCNSTTTRNPPENDDPKFQQQQQKEEMEDEEGVEIIRSKELNRLAEIEVLHNLVKELQQRKVSVQRKLLELCGLKEEQSYIAHLKRCLKDKSAEIDMLGVTIDSLQAERRVLREDLKQSVLVKKQVEMAKKTISELGRKMECCNERNMEMKGRLMMVEEQVCGFPKCEVSVRDAMVEKKLKAVENVELEVLRLKRRNKELEMEKRELALKLASAQARISALSNVTESETIGKVEEEIRVLRHANEELTSQVEELHKNRFDMVQELVYQRWLNACLRFEIGIQNSPSMETPRSYESPTSHTASDGLSDEIETTAIESSSSSQISRGKINKKSSGFMQSIRRWGRSKGDGDDSVIGRSKSSALWSKKGLVRRFSTSMVPVKTTSSILRNKCDQSTSSSSPSSKATSLSRVRRVSFSDSVKPTAEYCPMPESADRRVLADDKEMSGDDDNDQNSTQNYENLGLEGEEPHDEHTIPKIIKDDRNVDEIGHKLSLHLPCVVAEAKEINKVDTNLMGFVAALFLLLFILAASLTILFS